MSWLAEKEFDAFFDVLHCLFPGEQRHEGARRSSVYYQFAVFSGDLIEILHESSAYGHHHYPAFCKLFCEPLWDLISGGRDYDFVEFFVWGYAFSSLAAVAYAIVDVLESGAVQVF